MNDQGPGVSLNVMTTAANLNGNQGHEFSDDDEEEDDQRIEEEIAEDMHKEFGELSMGHEDSEEENGDFLQTPRPLRDPTSNFLTSTPAMEELRRAAAQPSPVFTQPIFEEDSINDNEPQRDAQEHRYLNAPPGDYRDQLATLYEARGREIERLKNELDSFREKKEQDDRLARHEIAILKADRDKGQAKLNELEDLYQNGQQDEQDLRDEVRELRETNAKVEREKLEVLKHLESSEQTIKTLESQLHDFQRSDTVLKAQHHHDAVVRSLKERHENEIKSMQLENERLRSLKKKQESEIDELCNKLTENQRHFDNVLMDKNETVEDLYQRLEKTQMRLTELMTETSNHDTNSLNMKVKFYQTEVEEYKKQVEKLQSMVFEFRADIKECENILDEYLDHDDSIPENPYRKIQARLKDKLIINRQKVDEVTKLKSDVTLKDRQLTECQKRIQQLLSDQETLKKQSLAAGDRKEVEDYKRIIERMKREEEQRETLLRSRDHEISNLEQKVHETKLELSRMQAIEASIRSDYDALKEELESTNRRFNERLTEEINRFKNSHSSMRSSPVLANEEIIRKFSQEKEELVKKSTEELKEVVTAYDHLQAEYSSIMEKHIALKKKVRAYQKHMDKREDFYKEEIRKRDEKHCESLRDYKARMDAAFNQKLEQTVSEVEEIRRKYSAVSLPDPGKENHNLQGRSNFPYLLPSDGLQSHLRDDQRPTKQSREERVRDPLSHVGRLF